MEQRMSYVTNLKNGFSRRQSLDHIRPPSPPHLPQPEDLEYQFIRQQVIESPYLQNSGRHVKIRLLNWIQRLDRVRINQVWKANRNNYIKLLNLMCHCEHITHPFLALPPDNDPPTLLKHEISRIIDAVQRQVRISKTTSRRTSAQVSPADLTYSQETANFNDWKHFKTNESNTFGESDGETIPLRAANRIPTFETDYDDKTIQRNPTFNRQFPSYSLEDDDKQREDIQSCINQTKELRNNSFTKLYQQFQNGFDAVENQKSAYDLKNNKNLLKTLCRPPLYRQGSINKVQNKINKGNKENKPIQQQRQYWESRDPTSNNTGRNTPSYLDRCPLAEGKLNESVEIVSYRDEGDVCDCTSKMLGEGWLSSLLKKMSIS